MKYSKSSGAKILNSGIFIGKNIPIRPFLINFLHFVAIFAFKAALFRPVAMIRHLHPSGVSERR